MQFDPILPEARVKAMKEGGFWPDQIVTDYLDRQIAEAPKERRRTHLDMDVRRASVDGLAENVLDLDHFGDPHEACWRRTRVR